MKKFKKVLCMLLTATMVLSMAACGKDEPGTPGSTPGVEKDPEAAAAAASAAKEYVYAAQEIDFGIDFSNVGMYGMACVDGRITVLVEDYNNQIQLDGEEPAEPEEPVADTGAAVLPGDLVDGDMAVIPEDGMYEEYVYTGPQYYFISVNVDGSDKEIKKLEMPDTSGGWGYISNFKMFADGSMVILYESYFEDYSDPNNPIFENHFDLFKWDAAGNLVYQKDMIEGNEDEYAYFYARNMMDNGDGSLTILSGDNEIITLDAQGQETSRVTMDDSMTMNMGQVLTAKDGSMYVTIYSDDWMNISFCPLDKTTGKVGEKIETPEGLANYGINPGSNSDFVLSNSMGIYSYNIGDTEPKKIMDFINSDVATYSLNNVTFIDDKSFVANYQDAVDYKTHVAVFTYVDPADIPDKVAITLGCMYLGSDIKGRVIDFNKTNSKYRITVNAYAETGDYEQAQTRMNNDIISGQMPDIIIIESDQDISGWVNKGLLADVKALIAADPELSKVEFLENVWEAFSINGNLYTVVPNFTVQTYVAKASLVGDKTGWTMSEFQQFLKTLDSEVLPWGSDGLMRDSFLYYMMLYCGSDFVDVNTGTCNFMSEEFIAMLEYAKSLPAEYTDDYWEDYDWTLYESQYRENRAVLMNLYISRISDLVYSIHGRLGDEAAFVGFPGISGNSSIIQPGSYQYALSATSANLDGAWSFVRYFLTDEYQSGDEMWSLPVSKSVFIAKAEESMEKPYWIDGEGNKVEYDNTYYMNGEEIPLEQFSQAEVDAICEFIYSVNKRSYYNQDIINIVNEEAASFFDGQKNARDVAAIIQSRVQLYVDENR